jgi:Zn-dependent protease with chaperone function
MNFFERQEDARRRTLRLRVAFALTVLAVVLALDAIAMSVLGVRVARFPAWAAHHVAAALGLTVLVLLPIATSVWRKSRELAEGGIAVARTVGALPVTREIDGGARLLNVLEEMALAARIESPAAFVIPGVAGINAFAAGRSHEDAVVVLTQGALAALDRDELQALVAHEFSHLLNGDMALNLRLVAWLHGLSGVARAGKRIVRKEDGETRLTLLALGTSVWLAGLLGHFAGRVLQASVSRRREELADASAVQFTRNPEALKRVLVKIAAGADASTVPGADSAQFAHMFFASIAAPPGGWFAGFSAALFATHPTIADRLRALDPAFDARALPRLVRAAKAAVPASPAQLPLDPVLAMPARSAVTGGEAAAPGLQALAAAARQDAALPGLLLGAMLGAGATRARHLAAIRRAFGEPTARLAERTAGALDAGPARARLLALVPVVERASRLPEEPRRRLARAVATLARDHSDPSLVQVCVAALVEARTASPRPAETLPLADALPTLAVLVAELARLGHPDDARRPRALAAGLRVLAPQHPPAAPTAVAWPADLRRALALLPTLHVAARRPVAEALVATAVADGRLASAEADLVRTACLLMEVPVPAELHGAALREPEPRRAAAAGAA